MPSVITHYSFAKKYKKDIDDKYLDAYYLGAQGPDHFFAYGMIPFRKRPNKKEVNSLGNITQINELTPNYIGFIEYAKNSEDKELLFSYIDGLLTHYSLDRCCHPFIFYQTGFTDRKEDSKEIHEYYNFSHLIYEVFADLIIGKKENTYGPGKKKIKIKNSQLKIISKMWSEVNKKYQRINNIEDDSFYKSVKDYQAALSLTYSPLGIKKWFLGVIFGKRSFPYGLSAPRNLNKFKDIDLLNELHSDWYMPNNDGPRNESFYDLFDVNAKQLYFELHECLKDAKNNKKYEEQLIKIANHVNHEGIVPNSEKLTWKLIWPKQFIDDIIEPNIKH